MTDVAADHTDWGRNWSRNSGQLSIHRLVDCFSPWRSCSMRSASGPWFLLQSPRQQQPTSARSFSACTCILHSVTSDPFFPSVRPAADSVLFPVPRVITTGIGSAGYFHFHLLSSKIFSTRRRSVFCAIWRACSLVGILMYLCMTFLGHYYVEGVGYTG